MLCSSGLSLLALDLRDYVVQRKVIDPPAALGCVISRTGTELTQEAQCIHNPQVPSENLPGSAVDLGYRSNYCTQGTTFITSSIGVTAATFNDFCRFALFSNLSSQIQKYSTSACAANVKWSESSGLNPDSTNSSASISISSTSPSVSLASFRVYLAAFRRSESGLRSISNSIA